MLKPIKFANAVAIVSAVWQIIYTAKLAVIPDSVHYWIGAMMPGYNLTAIETNQIDWWVAMQGTLIMAIAAWISVFVVIWLYNCSDK